MSVKDGYTLLVVDDDALYRERICDVLRDHTGWTVLSARDAADALGVVSSQSHSVDVVLVDTYIPSGTDVDIPRRSDSQYGIECAKLLRHSGNSCRVVGMSVDAGDSARLWFQRNADGFLDKTELKIQRLPIAISLLSGMPSQEGSGTKRDAVGEDVSIAENPPIPVRITVNDRMVATLSKDRDAAGWSSRKWATHLSCSASTVCGTPTWRFLREQQKLNRAERAVGKRRNRRPLEGLDERSV